MDRLKSFIEIPKIKHTLEGYKTWIDREFNEYSEVFDSEVHDFIKLRKKYRNLWVPLMVVSTSFRYCLENLSILNELQYQIIIDLVKDHLKNQNSDEVCFQRLNSFIYNEMKNLKVTYERPDEVFELFKEVEEKKGQVHNILKN